MTDSSTNTAPPRVISAAGFIIALVGLVDAGYLTAKHYSGTAVPCSLVSGCETVLTSEWSEIFGIPTALYGAVAYFAAFSIAFLVFNGNSKLWNLFGALSSIMFIASLGFIYIQAFVIQAFCQYCLVSAATSTLLFVVYIVSRFVGKQPERS